MLLDVSTLNTTGNGVTAKDGASAVDGVRTVNVI